MFKSNPRIFAVSTGWVGRFVRARSPVRAAPAPRKARRAGLSVARAHLPPTPSPSRAASSPRADGRRVVPDAAPLGLLGCMRLSTATWGRNAHVLNPLRRSCPVFFALGLGALLALAASAAGTADVPPILPGTDALDWPEREHAAMADRLRDGAHRFVDRKIREAITLRPQHWHHHVADGATGYESAIAANRSEFARLIGVVGRSYHLGRHFKGCHPYSFIPSFSRHDQCLVRPAPVVPW
jgi:hypothetical protein